VRGECARPARVSTRSPQPSPPQPPPLLSSAHPLPPFPSQPGNSNSTSPRTPYNCTVTPLSPSASPAPGSPDDTTTIYASVGAGVGGLVIGAAVGTWFAHRNAKAERKGAKRPSTGPKADAADDAFLSLDGGDA
jgi:hypothetical protein